MSKDMKLIMENFRKNVINQDMPIRNQTKSMNEIDLSKLNPFRKKDPYEPYMNNQFFAKAQPEAAEVDIHSAGRLINWRRYVPLAKAFIDFYLRNDIKHIKKVVALLPKQTFADNPILKQILKSRASKASNYEFRQYVNERWNNLAYLVNRTDDQSVIEDFTKLSRLLNDCKKILDDFELVSDGERMRAKFSEVADLDQVKSKDYHNPDHGVGMYGHKKPVYVSRGRDWANEYIKNLDDAYERDSEWFKDYEQNVMVDRLFARGGPELDDLISTLEGMNKSWKYRYGKEGLNDFADDLGLKPEDWSHIRDS